MTCTSLRIDEKKVASIREIRPQDEIREVKLGNRIQHSVPATSTTFEEWKNHISKELRHPSSPFHYVPNTPKPEIEAKQIIEEQRKAIWSILSIQR